MTVPSGARALSNGELLDLYKLTVEMADRVSARRGQANQFYVALQTALLGAPALFSVVGEGAEINPLRGFLLAVVGVTVSVVWWFQLRSYRDLNTAKFVVINKIEADNLPITPFSDEWAQLKKDPVPKLRDRYAELGFVERFVPIVFLLVNAALAVSVWL